MSIMHGRGVGNTVCDRLMGSDWVVYAKPCVSGAETVVAYLGRYNHRTALTDGRLLGFEGAQVHLAYNDYRDGDRPRSWPWMPRSCCAASCCMYCRRALCGVKGYAESRSPEPL